MLLSIWAVALGLAALAPWCVQGFVRMHQERVKRRTVDALTKARRAPAAPSSRRVVGEEAAREG